VDRRCIGLVNCLQYQSLLGAHLQRTESITQASLPQTAADASARWLEPSLIRKLAVSGCALRRLLDSGAHTTRQDTEQSSGIAQALWMVNATLSWPWSTWSKRVQASIDRLGRSASSATRWADPRTGLACPGANAPRAA